MNGWKVGIIIMLLVGVGCYGFYRDNPPSAAVSNAPTSADKKAVTAPPPAPPDSKITRLLNNPAMDWNIPPMYWANTPHPITLKDLKGHVTVLEFWRAGCIHCQEAAPFMSNLYKHGAPHGLKMVTFQSPGTTTDPGSLENDWQQVQGKIKQWQLPYPVAFDKGKVLFDKYHGSLYPMVFVLDKNGVIRFAQTGHDEAKAAALERFIRHMLGGDSATVSANSAPPKAGAKP